MTSISNPSTNLYAAHEQTTISTALHAVKFWEQFVDDDYFILKQAIGKLLPQHQESSSE